MVGTPSGPITVGSGFSLSAMLLSYPAVLVVSGAQSVTAGRDIRRSDGSE